MRAGLTGLILLLLLTPARGAYCPGEVEALWEQARQYGVEEGGSPEQSLYELLEQVPQAVSGLLTAGIRTGMKLLAVVLVCALAQGLQGAGTGGLSAVRMAGALSVTALTMTDISAMIGLGRDTIARMDVFSGVLLPAMAVLSAMSGGVSSAAVRQGATVLFSKLLVGAMDGVLIPLVYAYAAVSCARAAWGSGALDKLARGIKSCVTGFLTLLLVVFVTYLTASGAIAGSVDMSRVKTARMAISRAIPVVGSVLSDAAETVLAGAGALRGSVGAAGLAVVLVICLMPFLHLAGQYLIYKGTAWVCACVAQPELAGLIDAIGSAFGLVLGMTGAAALILLVSVVSAVLAVGG